MSFRPVDVKKLDRVIGKNGVGVLPPWGHFLGGRIFPLVTYRKGIVVPVGTAFSISPIGLSITAVHVLDQAFASYGGSGSRVPDPRINSTLGITPEHTKVSDPLMAISICSPKSTHSRVVKVGDSGTVVSIEPTDVGLISFQGSYPRNPKAPFWDALPISPLMPKLGSKVYCLGYCQYDDEHQLAVDELLTFDRKIIQSKLRPTYRINSGIVTDIYTEKYGSGYTKGPCFRIASATEHGQSGGPVINSEGYVCGINTSGTLDRDLNASLASALWPALGGKFNLHMNVVKQHRVPHTVTLMDLIERRYVVCDNSLKDRVDYVRDGQRSVMPLEAAVKLYQKHGFELPNSVRSDFIIPEGIHSDFAESDQEG